MCNCGAPNADNYNAFNAANADCAGYPHGSPGHGACITNALGFVRLFLKISSCILNDILYLNLHTINHF